MFKKIKSIGKKDKDGLDDSEQGSSRDVMFKEEPRKK